MTSEESRYTDILIVQGAQRKHLAKETEVLQTEAAKLGRSDGEMNIGKSILPKGSTLRDLPVYFDFELKENVIGLRSQLHRSCSWFHKPHNITERYHCQVIGSRCSSEMDAC